MKREEKRQKFHERLLRMLYPPPPSPPPHEENDEEPLPFLGQGINLDQIPDEVEDNRGSSSSGDQASDHGSDEKLTRAQRKRLRQKKLKEAASRCQNIIGPIAEIDGRGENVSTTEEIQNTIGSFFPTAKNDGKGENVKRNHKVFDKMPMSQVMQTLARNKTD